MSFNGHVGPLAITTDGLVGCWDAASQHSYPGTGTIWKDISGQGNDATATGGPIFVNQYGGYWSFGIGQDEYNTGRVGIVDLYCAEYLFNTSLFRLTEEGLIGIVSICIFAVSNSPIITLTI